MIKTCLYSYWICLFYYYLAKDKFLVQFTVCTQLYWNGRDNKYLYLIHFEIPVYAWPYRYRTYSYLFGN